MTTYATFSATYIVHDVELLKRKYEELASSRVYLEEPTEEDMEFMASQAILDLLDYGVSASDMGVEFYSSTCEPDTDDEARNASIGNLIYN